MRYRLPVALLAGALVGLSVGLVAVGRSVGSRRAMEWVERALGPSRPALSGEAVVGTRASGTWVERTAEVTEYGAVTRLEWLDDPRGRISLDDGTRLWELDPSTRTALLRGVSPAGADTGRLAANYRAEFAGWRDVAGYPTQGIRLRSRHYGDVAARLWVEPATGALLGQETVGIDGRVDSRTIFTRVDQDGAAPPSRIPPGWRLRSPAGQVAQPLAPGDLPGPGAVSAREPTRVPKGYRCIGTYQLRRGGRALVELRYHDGLRTLSVFERGPRGRGHGPGGGQGRGARGGGRGTQGRGRGGAVRGERAWEAVAVSGRTAVRERRDDIEIVAVGDVPRRALIQMVQSIP